MTQKRINLLLDNVLRGRGDLMLTYSINCASRETFRMIKGKDLFDITLKNVIYTIQKKKALNLTQRFYLLLQFLILKENEHEAMDFLNYWSKIFTDLDMPFGVGCTLPPTHHNLIIFKREFNPHNQHECDERYIRVIKKLNLVKATTQCPKRGTNTNTIDRRQPCPSLWLSPVIRADGTLNVCLSDIDNHMPLGNVFADGFINLWLSDTANEYRTIHLRGLAHKIPICSYCSYYEASDLHEQYWKEYENIVLG